MSQIAEKVRVEGLPESLTLQAVKFFCDFLDIPVPNLHIFTVEDMRCNGAMYSNSIDDFLIAIHLEDVSGFSDRNITEVFLTLAHEMVHVKQVIRDDLTKEFDTSIPYAERWWEKEAFELESVMMLAFVDEVKKVR
jgi:hypothetical protein